MPPQADYLQALIVHPPSTDLTIPTAPFQNHGLSSDRFKASPFSYKKPVVPARVHLGLYPRNVGGDPGVHAGLQLLPAGVRAPGDDPAKVPDRVGTRVVGH